MGKIPNKQFLDEVGDYTTLFAVVTATLRRDIFDANGKKMPTPYNLFVEWLRSDNGWFHCEWCSEKIKGGFLVRMEKGWESEILKKYPAIGQPKQMPYGLATLFNYTDKDYASLAVEIGYKKPFSS